jgi:ParB family transcriptional regulator, chromosome partitioning protein
VPKPKKTGLPEALVMRHDPHFVELLSSRSKGPLIRMISISRIDPNPHQARNELGDIQELMASIRARGVLEPILVRPKGDRYEIIAGERRYVASKNLGMSEIPCIEMNVDERESMELSLIENLQRKDLDVFEEADGLNALIDIYDYTHEQISDKIGKARSTITEILNISKIPALVRDLIKQAKIQSRSLLIEISKLKDSAQMEKVINEVKERGLKRADTRDLTREMKKREEKAAKPKRYVYNYAPGDGDRFKVRIEFKKSSVGKDEIIKILEELLEKLRG